MRSKEEAFQILTLGNNARKHSAGTPAENAHANNTKGLAFFGLLNEALSLGVEGLIVDYFISSESFANRFVRAKYDMFALSVQLNEVVTSLYPRPLVDLEAAKLLVSLIDTDEAIKRDWDAEPDNESFQDFMPELKTFGLSYPSEWKLGPDAPREKWMTPEEIKEEDEWEEKLAKEKAESVQ